MKLFAINTAATQLVPYGQAHGMHLHAANCACLKRYGVIEGGCPIMADSIDAAIADWYSDFLDQGEDSMTMDDCRNDARVFPCATKA